MHFSVNMDSFFYLQFIRRTKYAAVHREQHTKKLTNLQQVRVNLFSLQIIKAYFYTYIYQHTIADSTLLFNPEKGFYADYYSPGSPTWSEWRKNGMSIAIAHYILKNSGNVDPKIFITLKNDLENAKKSGMKLGLRFTYGEDTDADAPYETMKNHISQIQEKLTVSRRGRHTFVMHY